MTSKTPNAKWDAEIKAAAILDTMIGIYREARRMAATAGQDYAADAARYVRECSLRVDQANRAFRAARAN